MKVKLRTLLIVLAVFILSACAEIRNIIVFKPAPKHEGQVEIRISPQVSHANPLFQIDIYTDKGGGMPDSDLLKEVLKAAANHGANVLVFKCGTPGTVGMRFCHATGYFEIK